MKENRINELDHLEYILKKEKKTLSNWELIMFHSASFGDFEKPLTVETNTEPSQESKTSKNESATNQNVLNKKKVKQSKKEKRFPKGRLSQ